MKPMPTIISPASTSTPTRTARSPLAREASTAGWIATESRIANPAANVPMAAPEMTPKTTEMTAAHAYHTIRDQPRREAASPAATGMSGTSAVTLYAVLPNTPLPFVVSCWKAKAADIAVPSAMTMASPVSSRGRSTLIPAASKKSIGNANHWTSGMSAYKS